MFIQVHAPFVPGQPKDSAVVVNDFCRNFSYFCLLLRHFGKESSPFCMTPVFDLSNKSAKFAQCALLASQKVHFLHLDEVLVHGKNQGQ